VILSTQIAKGRELFSDDDSEGSLIDAWASLKSFKTGSGAALGRLIVLWAGIFFQIRIFSETY